MTTRRASRRPSVADRSAPLGWRVFGMLRSGILSLAAVIGAVCIVAFVAALAFNVRPVAVISGSMEPQIPVGAMVFTRTVPAGDVSPGDIVTVQRPRNLGLVTHRLVSSVEREPGVYEFVLRGDANDTDDPQPYAVSTVGQYVLHVPLLGYLTIGLQSSSGLFIAGGIALVLVALFLLDPARLRGSAQTRETEEESA
ncbi:signal peptidase I [Microbacterium sp. NM3R9]|uniref:signal peptidase I n=1 Tax=Microbacterium thalli TaxID=3027921 RepID=UPI00236549F4|nr:signal peptidase I [Microbacterium thalli]MDD7928349.1 signal peptidase I [Microbacterium thalli]MDN8548838.1 signal peptidase I [Microbacterium thalli]